MKFYLEAADYLKENRPKDAERFRLFYERGSSKISSATKLFRVMSAAEKKIWDEISPPNSDGMDPNLMWKLFEGGHYNCSWFTFDQPDLESDGQPTPRDFNPYVFKGKQAINNPKGREGYNYVMAVALRHQAKAVLNDTMIPDGVKLEGIPEHIKTDSSRCKYENGNYTLGLPLPVLEQMAHNMTIEHLGAHLVPHNVKLTSPRPPEG